MRLRLTDARGYGAQHQRLRRQLAPRVRTGTLRCARGAECKHAELVDGELIGGFIKPDDLWDLGHNDFDRSRYSGPEHRECNRATRGRRGRRRHTRDW